MAMRLTRVNVFARALVDAGPAGGLNELWMSGWPSCVYPVCRSPGPRRRGARGLHPSLPTHLCAAPPPAAGRGRVRRRGSRASRAGAGERGPQGRDPRGAAGQPAARRYARSGYRHRLSSACRARRRLSAARSRISPVCTYTGRGYMPDWSALKHPARARHRLLVRLSLSDLEQFKDRLRDEGLSLKTARNIIDATFLALYRDACDAKVIRPEENPFEVAVGPGVRSPAPTRTVPTSARISLTMKGSRPTAPRRRLASRYEARSVAPRSR